MKDRQKRNQNLHDHFSTLCPRDNQINKLLPIFPHATFPVECFSWWSSQWSPKTQILTINDGLFRLFQCPTLFVTFDGKGWSRPLGPTPQQLKLILKEALQSSAWHTTPITHTDCWSTGVEKSHVVTCDCQPPGARISPAIPKHAPTNRAGLEIVVMSQPENAWVFFMSTPGRGRINGNCTKQKSNTATGRKKKTQTSTTP